MDTIKYTLENAKNTITNFIKPEDNTIINDPNLKKTSFNVEKDYKKYNEEYKESKYKEFYNKVEYKTQLLNIDSQFRDKIPKNIYTSTNNALPNNPVLVTQNSNIIQINYPNHNFSIGDTIIVQNVIGNYKILTNSLYFFNNFSYMFINYKNHNVPVNFNSMHQISIEIISDIGTNTSYYNIPINLVTNIFNVTLPSIVDKLIAFPLYILQLFNVSTVAELDENFLLIQLPYEFTIDSGFSFCPSDVFKFTFLNIGGIPLHYINADYPIDYNKYQSYQEITNIDKNNIYFNASVNADSTVTSGGNNVQIMLITNTLAGFPNCNSYSINLKKCFNNVVRIELVSTEFPYIDFLVKSSGPYVNNKLYWKHIDDGNYIYSISILEGNYNTTSIITAINTAINSIPRINSTIENPIYNIFTVNLNTFNQEITFTAFKNNKLPNSLTASLVNIDNIQYVQLTIYHPSNLVEISDTIIISGAIKIGNILDPLYLNQKFTVYNIDKNTQTYFVLISPLSQITNLSQVTFGGNGGPGVIIQTNAKVSFIFTSQDTLGNILGFKNTGQSNAITPFKSIISNFDSYIQSTNLNQVGNIDNSTTLLNFSGSNLYILMYINNYECVVNNSNQDTAFAKILLSGNIGDILFNTFVNYPLEFDIPISTLNQIDIVFKYPNGSLVDFRNIDHSFTLRIVEKTRLSYNTGINSKDTNVFENL